ncbi:MAG: MFS transporter [Candidatus Baltobacteraceae bacterium]
MNLEAGRPSRGVVAMLFLLAFAIFINYIDRGNLGTAATLVQNELHLSTTQLGFLLTAIFITYVPMQPVVGLLVDRFGGSRVLVAGFLIWSLATVLSGFAAGFAALFAFRLLLGVGESVTFPAVARIVAECVPQRYLGFANGVTQAGLQFGPAFGVFFGGMLIAAHGWRWFFVAFGLCSFIWVAAWLILVKGSTHSPKSDIHAARPSMKLILREPSLWGASIGHFCGNYALYFVLTWIPYYLVHERHWSLQQMAVIAGSTYLLGGCGQVACGSLADALIRRGLSATVVRKTSCGIGAVGLAICMLGCAYSGDVASVVWLILAGGVGSFLGVNTFIIAQSIAGPDGTGRWVGIQNMIGNIAGLIAPSVTGILAERTGNFIVPFTITAIVTLAGGASWIFLVGKIERVDWSARAALSDAAAARAGYESA